MLSPQAEGIQEVTIEGGNPPNPRRVSAPNETTHKDDGGAGVENVKKSTKPPLASGEPSNNATKVSSSQPADAIAAQPQSIWYRYVTTAEKRDQQTMEMWKANMNNLLIFAALFTAIVTAFALDAMPDLIKQSATNSTTGTPPSNSSSIFTVSSLWFLSIISSLAATTWAILCLEWCAFLTGGIQAEGYEEMAEERQRKYEAVKRWKMHLIVSAIPSFLHLSLFLFLAGLWLRLRDVNEQLGLIVGVPSLVIASSYVVVTLLPIFTSAPFSTSASELVQPIFDGIRCIAELRHFVHPPPIFSRITSPPKALVSSRRPRPWRHRLTIFLRRIFGKVRPFVHDLLKTIALLPIIPVFGLKQNPFKELNKLKVGRLDRDKGIRLRALFWLIKTPLSKDEVMGVLEEFMRRNDAGKPLGRTIARLLVLSLSSVLEDNRVSEDERPIFDHCTKVLAEEMDRAFGNEEYSQGNFFRNAMISEKLSPHFDLTPSDEGALSREDYWARAFPALWLCPSTKTIRNVVNRLNSDVRSMEKLDLKRIVRGLHAAILTRSGSDPDQPTLELIPDFSLWGWDSNSSDRDLDRTLSKFLQGVFAAFYTTLRTSDRPTTTPSLIIDCLGVLDRHPERYTLKLHNALCFFVVVTQRSDPKVFERVPSVASGFLESAESWKERSGGGDSRHTEILVTRLRAVAYGPKPLISRESRPLGRLGDLYAGLPDSIRKNHRCLGGFLDANAAILEATFAADSNFTMFFWRRSPDYKIAQNIWTDPLFTNEASIDFLRQYPNSRLPYLYSLAIALSHTTEGRREGLWRVADLFVTRDQQEGIATDSALNINTLAVFILRFALHDRSGTLEQERKEAFLKSLRDIVIDGINWRTRWKSIYLVADLACLLSQMNNQLEGEGDKEMEPLINAASEYLDKGEVGHIPLDWEKKKKGLALCKLEAKVRGLISKKGEGDEAVYEWSGREDVPYLFLYSPQRALIEPVSDAAHWFITRLRRRSHDGPVVSDTPGVSNV